MVDRRVPTMVDPRGGSWAGSWAVQGGIGNRRLHLGLEKFSGVSD